MSSNRVSREGSPAAQVPPLSGHMQRQASVSRAEQGLARLQAQAQAMGGSKPSSRNAVAAPGQQPFLLGDEDDDEADEMDLLSGGSKR